jgi:hypothetical protein
MMRMRWALALAVLLAAAGGALVLAPASRQATAADVPARPNTEQVRKGELSSIVSLSGILTRRARPDGSPYAAVNQARGVYTRLPEEGAKAGCGDVLYRVDERPVLLLCGRVPAYRDLRPGDRGGDVRQLNRNLHVRGSSAFTSKTSKALKRLQRRRGMAATGRLALGAAVFLPEPVRIAKMSAKLGESARPGAAVAQATSDTLEVQVNLEPAQQGEIQPGDAARITLPDNRSAQGTVDRLGRIARVSGPDKDASSAVVPAYSALDDPTQARGPDRAPVSVEIATKGVRSALSVPVTALVGSSGGGFAVEVVGAGGRRELVAVELGLFDTAGGRVQVDGELAEGDRVVVPSP